MVDKKMTSGGPTARSIAAARIARERWEAYAHDPRRDSLIPNVVAPRPW